MDATAHGRRLVSRDIQTPLGYEAKIQGTVVLSLKKPKKFSSTTLRTRNHTYTASGASVTATRQLFLKDVAETCASWKEDVYEQLGSKAIYASCAPTRLVLDGREPSHYSASDSFGSTNNSFMTAAWHGVVIFETD